MAGEELVAHLDDVHMVFSSGLKPPVWALRGLTLALPRGAVLGLLGPNGAGKTTAISCLLGLLEPQVGVVTMWGRRLYASRGRREGRLCGALLEDTRLPPFLSVRTALAAVGAIRHVPNPARELDRVVALTAIEGLLSRRVAVLSKGQARRVGLAAALIGDPPLLILDEPSAGLDAESRVEFENLVRGLRDARRTMLIASHLLGDVEATCSHIAVVRDGRVLLAGRSSELLADARQGQSSDVYVDALAVSKLDELGISHETARYPGLVLLRSDKPEEDLFAALAGARVVPRRVEPRVSVLSLYLDVTRRETAA
jgi:ABC-2 type transport system ATP-binding protein